VGEQANGAGKTTLIRMLSGMIEPSSGDAEIYGNSILDDFDNIRTDFGFCPQHDILYDKLTVREHLTLFARIKNIPDDEVELCVEKSVHEVELDDKIDTQALALSGGMKRKLSTAIALIGGSRVVFLDEPTSGMDVAARRQLQELLQNKKEGRCIILTTHYLDEADFLGDRIAIMAKGKVVCSGSSLFLKQNYGVGYQLTITKDNNIRSQDIIKLVKTQIPNCEVITNAGNEVKLRLPFQASSRFPNLFDNLDVWNSQHEIGGIAYGIAVTTLEEVFLKVGMGEDALGESRSAGISISDGNWIDGVRKTLPDINSGGLYKPQTMGSSGSPQTSTYDDTLLGTPRTEIWSEPTNSKYKLDFENASISEISAQQEEGRRNQIIPSWAKCVSLKVKKGGTSVNSGVIEYNPADLKGVKKTPTTLGHIKALFWKRFYNQLRDKKAFVCIVLIPTLVLVAGIGLQTLALKKSMPELLMTTDYGNSPNRVTVSENFPVDDYRRPNDTFKLVNVRNVPGKNALDRMNTYLLDTNLLWEQSRYGAIAVEDWSDVKVTVLANTTDRHSIPVYVNLLSNLYLRNQYTKEDQSISISYQPFPFTKTQKSFIATVASVMINIAISFVPANYAAMVVQDRATQSKHLQVVSGVSLWSYWLINWAFDFMTYLIPLCICLIVVNIFDVVMLTGEYTLPFFTLLFFHGVAVIPYVYVLSFLFEQQSSAQNFILMWLLITGPILGIVVMILTFTTGGYDPNLEYLWMVFPNYALNHGTGYLMVCTIRGLGRGGKWGRDVTGYPVTYMASEAIVYFMILMVIEKVLKTPWLKAWCHKDPTVNAEPSRILDEDVIKEKRRILKQRSVDEGDIVQLKELRKVYSPKDNSLFSNLIPCYSRSSTGKPPKVAVDNLTFAVRKGECFGFLGVNGAGKTSTLKILTGDILPTEGGATLNGYDLLTQMNQVRKHIGYCPQFDAIIPNLTAREHLYLYARIKGLPEEVVERYSSFLLRKIGLKDYADLPCRGYSGGNKRKLSVGIALIGDPPVVFLDEPSSGMDPESRRFMWNLIDNTMSGRSLILTTHSMAEAEALCDRIGIMVNGQLKCLGTAQHLRTRYGRGYQIDLNVARDAQNNISAVREWIQESFENGLILDENAGNFVVRISKNERPLGAVFRLIEDNRAALGISEYSVAETSLEQIFIGFAKTQRQEDD
jgi:ATP-binding cassette subfamily A (ABC1) protein 3